MRMVTVSPSPTRDRAAVSWASISSMPTPQRFHMHRMTQQMIAGATTAIGCWLSSTMA